MESDGNQINRPCAHDLCMKWKQDGGHIRCQSLLTLCCETGSDVTKDDWTRALPSILGEASPQFYGRCLQCIVGPRRGYEYTWYFVVRFLNRTALLKAEQRLRTTVEYCLGYSKKIYGKKFKLDTLKESLRRNLRTLAYDLVDCLLYLAGAVSSDTSYKSRHSFGCREVTNMINNEIRWYNNREHAAPSTSRVTKDTPLSPSGQTIREKFIRKGKRENSRRKRRRGSGQKSGKQKMHENKVNSYTVARHGYYNLSFANISISRPRNHRHLIFNPASLIILLKSLPGLLHQQN